MNVTSLELCKELYELSGWVPDSTHEGVYQRGSNVLYGHKTFLLNDGDVPAYDLGYLLRKLPKSFRLELIKSQGGSYCASAYFNLNGEGLNDQQYHGLDFTPEDAACKLAIELFKKGILKRAES